MEIKETTKQQLNSNQNQLSNSQISKRKLNICMVSDFFYPNIGGVENHIYQLSVYLQKLGHNVIVLTHFYKDRQGIRYMGNGLKVYYLPFKAVFENIVFPTTLISKIDVLRKIYVTEKIDVVHVHQYSSNLALECVNLCGSMGIPSVSTEHSLQNFEDLKVLHLNKLAKCFNIDIDHIIHVSYAGKENHALRTNVNPDRISVIPNCIDFSRFKPKQDEDNDNNRNYKNNNKENTPIFNPNTLPMKFQYSETSNYRNDKKLTIVSIARQTYRKGTDLLIEVIPILYKLFPNINIIIGGDGDKKHLLDKMVQHFDMKDRVILTGGLPHYKVKEVLQQGDIFLNTSLTEAFCIAILEAASTGLFVVSTNIGGVAEVLPEHMRILVEPNKKSFIEGIIHAIENFDEIKKGTPYYNSELVNSYNWYDNAILVENIYYKILKHDKSPLARFRRLFQQNKIFSYGYMLMWLSHYLLLFISVLLNSNEKLLKENKVKKFDREKYLKFLEKLDKEER